MNVPRFTIQMNWDFKLATILMLLMAFNASYQLSTEESGSQHLDGDFGARFIRRKVKKFLRSAKPSDYGSSSSSAQSANGGYSNQGQSASSGYSNQDQSASSGYSNQGQSANAGGYSNQGQSPNAAGYSNQGQSANAAGYSNQGQSANAAGYSNQGQSANAAGYSNNQQSANSGYSNQQAQQSNNGYSNQQKTASAGYSNDKAAGDDGYGNAGGDSYGDDQDTVTFNFPWLKILLVFIDTIVISDDINQICRVLECLTTSTGPSKMRNPRMTTATKRKVTVR